MLCRIFQYPLTKVRFLCYLVHGELLCGGLVVRTPILPQLGSLFFCSCYLPMYCTSTGVFRHLTFVSDSSCPHVQFLLTGAGRGGQKNQLPPMSPITAAAADDSFSACTWPTLSLRADMVICLLIPDDITPAVFPRFSGWCCLCLFMAPLASYGTRPRYASGYTAEIPALFPVSCAGSP